MLELAGVQVLRFLLCLRAYRLVFLSDLHLKSTSLGYGPALFSCLDHRRTCVDLLNLLAGTAAYLDSVLHAVTGYKRGLSTRPSL